MLIYCFQWDVKTHQKVNIVSDHAKAISDLQLSADRTMFISASKDTTAKLWDMDLLENKKTYKTERPVNSASISPTKDHVVLGGGQVKICNLYYFFVTISFIKVLL